jgi:hypothetical protein
LPSPPPLSVGANRSGKQRDPFESDSIQLAQATEELPPGTPAEPTPLEPTPDDDSSLEDSSPQDSSLKNDTSVPTVTSESIAATGALPPAWPTESCFVPASPQADRPACDPHHGPVLKHTRVYNGTDPDFTQALQSYAYFREDARFGGWEAYLQRSDDFIRFCCHMHISEMLSARGGSHKTRVVWRWPESR